MHFSIFIQDICITANACTSSSRLLFNKSLGVILPSANFLNISPRSLWWYKLHTGIGSQGHVKYDIVSCICCLLNVVGHCLSVFIYGRIDKNFITFAATISGFRSTNYRILSRIDILFTIQVPFKYRKSIRYLMLTYCDDCESQSLEYLQQYFKFLVLWSPCSLIP